MSTFLIAVLATIAPPADASANPVNADRFQISSGATVDTPRYQFETPQKLRAAVHSAMRRAATTNGREQVPAIHELMGLYEELGRDARMARDDRIELRGTIRNRLKRISDQLTRSIARENDRKPVSVNVPKHASGNGAVLAQQIAPAGAGVAGGAAGPGAAGQIGGQRGPVDYGPALVELIQKTIAPASWDINGGEGTIVYYAPLQVLVVRQTGDVHADLGGLIRDLQK